MDLTYWHKQTMDAPLFPDLQWSRPEHKKHAGKLLIIGGNLHGFAAPAEAYIEANRAGVGLTRVLLPDAVKKIAGNILETVDYAPSTPSGSFSRQALADFIEQSAWADSVLLVGDFGRNSETAILLEKFMSKLDLRKIARSQGKSARADSGLTEGEVALATSKEGRPLPLEISWSGDGGALGKSSKFTGPVVIAKDAADYFLNTPKSAFERPNTTFVVSMAQLQKIVSGLDLPTPVTFGMDLLKLVDTLHQVTKNYPVSIVVKHLNNILVAVGGQVSTTKLETDLPVWQVKTATHASVWLIQNPSKAFEALTTSLLD
ncbi:hypothetical protein HY003_03405 [Candidatus Saccharibacteria bacterium]|nr:hypothetical protein [Candidatus Saccharibacteria bacterium]MBI3338321.1 hypothetical protein [Candidatus Saccharibacteria bacterium]